VKILHTESSCGWGGQEIRVLAEVEGLARRGHHLVLAAPPESRIFAEANKRSLPTRALPIARKSLAGWRALGALLESEPMDAVNTHSSTDSWLVALACLGLKDAPAVVRTRHISAPIPKNFLSRWLYRRATDRVVTTGESLRQQVIERTGADPMRVTSVPTGIDLARFRPGARAAARARLGLSAEAFLVGIVATLRSWKGHLYLLDALAQIPDPNVKIVVVGTGPMEENIRSKAAQDGLAARVIMAGHHDDVVPWLQSFDVFALPSYANEGVPQAVMQAMACGLPVITTGVGAIGEVAREGATARVVAPRDAAALAAAILHLRDDPAERSRLGDAAAGEARARFSGEIMLDRMEAVFHSAIRDARGAPG
jgi:glycosyltransferase involved in cell wall biosynthesis